MSDQGLADLLLERTPQIMAFTLRDRIVTRCSQGARDSLNTHPGQPIDPAFDDRSLVKLAEALSGAPAMCELQGRIRGELVALRVAVLPLDGGEHLLLVGQVGVEYAEAMARQLLAANDHLANVTRELARQAADLDAARRRFEALAELREHFISMLAHDVHGALTAVLLTTESLDRATQRGAIDQIPRLTDRIRRNARRVTELVDKVLEAARTETGRVVLETAPVAMREVAREALETYRAVAEARGVELAMPDSVGPDVVSGDRVRLGQVTGNLIENAIRHSPRGGKVTVEVSGGPAAVRIVVRDQGRGVPAELRDRIFERFVQGPGGGGSLGLGLYVARQLVELHHGRIWVEDVVPHGAAMIIELPASEVT